MDFQMVVIGIIEVDGLSIASLNRAVTYMDIFRLKFLDDIFKVSWVSFEGKV